MSKPLFLLILLVACGSDEPSTELATIYQYSLVLNQPPGVDCTGGGFLDFEADTLGVTTECFGTEGGTGEVHATLPITDLVQDGASLSFDAEECAHTGTIADQEINGTVTCVAPAGSGELDISGTWTATATE